MASETSPTVQLAQWIASTQYSVPDDVRTRAKHLILDGIACLLIGPHLPWSEKATRAIMTMDPIGYCTIAGWERKTSPLSAALINSTFIQGFELDDWHSEAPLHSNAILIPTLLALCEHLAAQPGGGRRTVTGEDFLDSMIVGYEVGPRVGRGLWGPHILVSMLLIGGRKRLLMKVVRGLAQRSCLRTVRVCSSCVKTIET